MGQGEGEGGGTGEGGEMEEGGEREKKGEKEGQRGGDGEKNFCNQATEAYNHLSGELRCAVCGLQALHYLRPHLCSEVCVCVDCE